MQLVLSPLTQAAALSLLLVGTAALLWLAVSYVGYGSVVANKEAAVMQAESANADLQDSIAKLQDQLAAAAEERQAAQDRLAALTGQSGTLRGLLYTAEAKLHALDQTSSQLSQQRTRIQQQLAANPAAAGVDAGSIASLSKALERAQRELFQAQAQRATLAARLGKTEADLHSEQSHYGQYKHSYDEAAHKLQQLIAERDKAAHERDQLKARIGKLQKKLSQRHSPAMSHQAAATRAVRTAVVAASPRQMTNRDDGLVASGRRKLDQVTRVLASTGVDVKRLFARFGVDRAEGGPFVPLAQGRKMEAALSPQKMAALRRLARALPLDTPIAHYRVGSRFGARVDPFNGRASFHTGLDLDAPYMTPVYATAPGIVTYAGYRHDYGKVVEIDHGNGISTLYAHLHRYTVSVGQRVSAHTQIGYLGSTGRATGPHVHYEIRVDGEPQDPQKFLALAHLIAVAQR